MLWAPLLVRFCPPFLPNILSCLPSPPLCTILYGLGESQLGDSDVPMQVFGNVNTTVGNFMSF